VWLVAVSFVVVAFATVSLWLAQARRLRLKSWLGSAVLVAWVVGVGIKLHVDQVDRAAGGSALVLPSIAWPAPSAATASEAAPSTARAPAVAAATGSAGKEVAPVGSLIGGLEQRLAAQPNDANGWALLAQSYAFLGNTEAAERAMKRAVALGVDEQTLRARMEGAQRSPPQSGGAKVGG
jgi:hypothetical protein